MRPKTKLLLRVLLPVLIVYLLLAYLILPLLWRHYEHQKKLDGLPMVTATAQGIPGDPINVALVGSQKDVLCAMREAGWYAADPVTWKSSIEISGSVVLDHPYPHAPVSPLYYAGRPEDLAFEKPVGTSADRRHHVRLWQVLDNGEEGRPVWLGAATFDRGVGRNRVRAGVAFVIIVKGYRHFGLVGRNGCVGDTDGKIVPGARPEIGMQPGTGPDAGNKVSRIWVYRQVRDGGIPDIVGRKDRTATNNRRTGNAGLK